uniref:Uncharacterized protein n=1 Tax=Rhizobium rhizogenes TaxID=359 RepID=A0A7S5DRI6_RHIRH|nr:hypothetical protein pC5.8b_271 [Rhizobium rhizogenes]
MDVPASSRLPKYLYFDEPSYDVIVDIKRHIRETGEPWTWTGHTHTNPPKGSLIRYIGEFGLSEEYRKRKLFTPCPCCSPDNRKFGDGKIAWFPDEGVIRLIGPHCARTLDAAMHDEAIADFNRRKQETRDRDFILDRRYMMSDWMRICDELIEIAKGADAFFPSLSHAFEKQRAIPIWRHVRTGQLQVWTDTPEVTMGANGQINTRMTKTLVNHAVLDGYAALSPNRPKATQNLIDARKTLHAVDSYSEDYIKDAALPTKTQIANDLSRALQLIKRGRSTLAKEIAFLRPENVQRLRFWGRREDAPVQFEFAVEQGFTTLALPGGTALRVVVPESIRGVHVPPFQGV